MVAPGAKLGPYETIASIAGPVLAACALAAALLAQSLPADDITILETSASARAQYLAEAIIWQARELPTPGEILEGPPGRFPVTRADANKPQGIPCVYKTAGTELGGSTEKFMCTSPDGQSLRVKYYGGERHQTNREIFSEVVATRLFWALGFDADAMYPIVVDCQDCPADPMSGHGPRASRRFLAVFEPHFEGQEIISTADVDQGWTFGELDEAIERLPPGELKERQRAHFDALSLLAVLVQHGDRKPSQQRLVCRGGLEESAGEVRRLNVRDKASVDVPAFFEHPGRTACRASYVTVQDLGATFGGAGRTTQSVSAKMHLKSWADRRVLTSEDKHDRGREPKTPPAAGAVECHGSISSSFTAGGDRRDDPRIGEAGRRLLADRLSRLTDQHIQALFEAGRVELLPDENEWRDPRTNTDYHGLDAWVEVFKQKRTEIVDAKCQP